jgi:hypothetical protein
VPPPVAADQLLAAAGCCRKNQRPVGIAARRRHKSVGYLNRKIEMAQPSGLALSTDERFDVRVIAAQGTHDRGATRAGCHQGLAHRVPDLHEGNRPGRSGSNALCAHSFGSQCREIVSDTTALLQRQSTFAQCAQDARERVLDNSHNETIEQRHAAAGAGPGQNPSAWQELVALENFEELVLPRFAIAWFNAGDGASDALPSVFNRLLAEMTVFLVAIFSLPDVVCDLVHRRCTTSLSRVRPP